MMKEIPHGIKGYDYYRCRCDTCKEANRLQKQAWRQRNIDRGLNARGKVLTRRRNGEEPPHGTRARYIWIFDPCRCELCRSASTAYNLDLIEMRSKMNDIPHGTANGYNNYKCRCDACREAHRIRMNNYNGRKRFGHHD
jgi:hypothetical protein